MKTETPRSLDNGARLLLKRSGENGGNDGEVPSKKTNLFIDCIRLITILIATINFNN